MGSIRWRWKSKVHDLQNNGANTILNALVNFTKTVSSQDVQVKLYTSQDPDMGDADLDQTITFDSSLDYWEPLTLFDNRARYFQYEVTGHGPNDPVVVNNVAFNFLQHLR